MQTQGIDLRSDAGSPSEKPAAASGAALYAQAITARNASVGHATASASASSSSAKKGFLTAEEEKEALARRFNDARAAADRNQAAAYGSLSDGPTPPPLVSSPISYESLSAPPPSSGSHLTVTPQLAANEQPPSFDFSSSSQGALSEKERVRRAFAERDAAALAAQATSPAISAVGIPGYFDAVASSLPPTRTPPPSSSLAPSNSLSEKERLRRHFEEQDAARMNGTTPVPPPRSLSGRGLPTPRAKPLPPGGASGSSSRLLSAAEEKARLAAAYAAEASGSSSSPPAFPTPQHYTNGTNGMSNGVNGNGRVSRQPSTNTIDYSSIPPPPPLMPRPPKEYIQETQEEDQTVAAKIEAMDKHDSGIDLSQKLDPSLDLRPFTPFTAEFDANRASAMPPPPLPPLPPKVSVSDG